MIRRALSMVILALALPGVALAAQLADGELVQMGRAIPGFGGMFYDAEGYPNVYLRDPQATPALSALKSLAQGEVRVLRGDYDFAQLVEWKRALRPAVLGQPGVVFLDADETRNRVVVGIDAAQAKRLDASRLDRALAASGVPREAVLYQEVPAIRELTGVWTEKAKKPASSTILDAARPVPGGVQIIFVDLPLAYFCTAGFNAYLDGDFGFVTNSHCTKSRGTVDDTPYVQGDDPFASTIATEIADPPYFTNATDDRCPSGYKCRYSDSSFAKYDTPSLGSLGKVAKTSKRGALAGSLTLKPSTSRFSISGTASVLEGQTVNKVGVTSGWTYGPVIATCADIGVTGTTNALLCQNIVKAGSDHGDSGSPVFSWTKGTTVKLLGILWGGGTSNGVQIFAYSPLANIQQELGTLRVK